MDAFAQAMELLEQARDDSVAPFLSSGLEETSRTLKKASGLSSLLTRAINLLNSTVSPVNPGSSAPSNGIFSATAATSTYVSLATLTQQLLSLCGLDLGGPGTVARIARSQTETSIDITLTVSCARKSDTAQTSEANPQQSPSRPSSP